EGELTARSPGPPVHATPAALAEHAASSRSGIEERLLALGREQWLHPGHVVAVLASAGALDEGAVTRRGPGPLARRRGRGAARAGPTGGSSPGAGLCGWRGSGGAGGAVQGSSAAAGSGPGSVPQRRSWSTSAPPGPRSAAALRGRT